MKKLYTLAFMLLLGTVSFGQGYELNVLGNWDDDGLPTHFYGTFNDCWGYAVNDREYALAGSASFVHIFDITDPGTITEIERIPGGEQTVWRDMKTYQDRAYFVSDGTGEGLIIVNMGDLPNSATVTYQSAEFFGSAHDIFIDEANARLYAVGVSGSIGSIVILDISNPDQPVLLANQDLNDTYIHDLYVRDHIAYCSSAWDGLYVWDLEDALNPVLIATLETNGYNHSNWVSEDGNTIIVAEEVPTGLPLLTVDATNLMSNDLTILTDFVYPNILNAPTSDDRDMYATPHNPYIIGDFAYVSYYEDGIVVFDLSDPAAPEKIAVFDSHPENDDASDPSTYGYHGYAGCWGVYPFLPSGNIIATDFDHGLYVLDLATVIATDELPQGIEQFSVYPSPVRDLLKVDIESNKTEEIQLQLTDISGRVILTKTTNINGFQTETLDLSSLNAGMYFLNLQSGSSIASHKVIKQ